MTNRGTIRLAAFILAVALTGAVSLKAIEVREARGEDQADTPGELAYRDAQIAAWSNALEVDPASAIALAQLAGLHLQRARESGDDSDFARAEQYARRSLALRINRNAKTYVTLATALVAQHRFAEAEAVARKAVSYDPSVEEYSALLADIEVELGDYASAGRLFSALQNRSRLSIAPRLARWAELNGDTETARTMLRRAADIAERRKDIPREQLAWFHFRLGDLEMRNGRFNKAKAQFRKGLKAAPADYRILSALARLSLMDDKPGRAIEYGERALSVKIDPATIGVLADAHLAMGDSAAAEENIAAMEVAVRGQPGAYHRAWSLFLLDHDRRISEVHANAAGELVTRKDVYGYDVLAWSLYRLGRFDDAAAQMRNAMQLGTRDAMLYYHAGMIEHALGHRSEAIALLRMSLDINEHFDARQSLVAKAALASMQ
jgi:tetratricopeptide (TPR) repeat protein